jgi:hypothetical protein
MLAQQQDTVSVFQNDSLVFNSTVSFIHRPCSNPELHVAYTLIDPKEGVYYYIYNKENQLMEEGVCSSREIEGVLQTDLYDSKYYHYRKSGKLHIKNFQENGRTNKPEY